MKKTLQCLAISGLALLHSAPLHSENLAMQSALAQARDLVDSMQAARQRSTDRQINGNPASVGPGCDYAQISDALANNESLIHVVKNYVSGPIFSDSNVTLIGGFADCNAAENGAPDADGFSIIDGGNSHTVVQLITTNVIDVQIENFNLTHGASETFSPGGAMSIILPNGGDVGLNNISFLANTGVQGGGIFMLGGGAGITQLSASNIYAPNTSNQAEDGGFFYCNNASAVFQGFQMYGKLLTSASGHGGAIRATNGCQVHLISKKPTWPPNNTIFANQLRGQSQNSGGAVYADGGSTVGLWGQFSVPPFAATSFPLQVAGTIDAIAAVTKGGGLYLSDAGTQAFIAGATLVGSSISGDLGLGGAAAVENSAELVIARLQGACGGPGYPYACNEVLLNRSQDSPENVNSDSTGGVLYASSGAQIDISQALLRSNQTAGYVIDVRDAGTQLTLEGNAINSVSGSMVKGLVRARFGAQAVMAYNSISISPSPVFNNFVAAVVSQNATTETHASIFYSTNGIFEFPNFSGMGTPVGDDVFSCVLLDETESIAGTSGSGAELLPGNSGSGLADYPYADMFLRLKPNSPAVDKCNTLFYTPQNADIEDETRGVCARTSGCSNGFSFDAGADETSDLIFRSPLNLIYP